MIKEEVRKQIIEEIQPEMDNIDVEKSLTLLCKILEMDCDVKELSGIKDRYPRAIERAFDTNTTHKMLIDVISTFFNVEPLFKLILKLVNESEYKKVMDNHIGLSGVLKRLGLNPHNTDLSKDKSFYEGKGNYIGSIAIVYQLRNIEAHTCESFSRREMLDKLYAVMISILYCIDLKKSELEKVILYEKMQIDEQPYMEELIAYFKKKMNKYIMLNGEENLQMVDRYIVEHIEDDEVENDGNSNSKGRKGTIDEIRRNKVPEKRMLIWGEAGTGKSTTLEYLAYVDAVERLKNPTAPIPVLIPLGLLVDRNVSLKEYIAMKINATICDVEDLLRNGKINVFMDGINEIPSDKNQLKNIRLREIRDMIDEYTNSFIIVSNRPNDDFSYHQVPIFNLIKLNNEQLQLFIERNAEKKETVQIITEAISANVRLKNVVRTPLMLSRLVATVDATGKVPSSEGEIVGVFLDTLLKREKTEKMDSYFDVRKANYILRSIAYYGLEDTSTNAGLSEDTIFRYIKKSMDTYSYSVDAFYFVDILVQLGILTKRDELYLFTHQVYQDYYYAKEQFAILGL